MLLGGYQMQLAGKPVLDDVSQSVSQSSERKELLAMILICIPACCLPSAAAAMMTTTSDLRRHASAAASCGSAAAIITAAAGVGEICVTFPAASLCSISLPYGETLTHLAAAAAAAVNRFCRFELQQPPPPDCSGERGG